jgi:hypothetical protein
VVGILLASANCELKTVLINSTEKDSGSVLGSVDVQVRVVCPLLLISDGGLILMAAFAREAMASAAANTLAIMMDVRRRSERVWVC